MFSGLTNNTETGLGLGIRASHKGIDGGHCGVSCNSNLPLLKTSSSFDGHFTETVLPRGEILNIKPKSQQHRLAASLCTLSKSSRNLLISYQTKTRYLSARENPYALHPPLACFPW